jgi:anti-sigma B factor antagonist
VNRRSSLAIIVGQHGDRPVLRLQGELDASSWDQLRRALSTALERHPPVLVLDTSGLEFTDCGGLSILVWAHRQLAERGHQLIITGATPMVRRLLYLTGLEGYLHLSSPPGLGTPVSNSPETHASGSPRTTIIPGPAADAPGSAHADLKPC